MKSTRPQGRLGAAFRKLWAAAALSNLGDGIALVAAPLLMAQITRNPTLVAGLAFCQQLPWLLFPLFSGALADRLDRRRALVAVGLCRAVVLAAIGVAVVLDMMTVPLLFALLFLLTTAETFVDTAAAALLPSIVDREQLPRANARLAGTLTVTNQFLGKPLGGLLFATAAALPFLLGAGGVAAAALFILAFGGVLHGAGREATSRRPLRREIGEGLRWLVRHRLLRTVAVCLALLNVTVVAQNAVLVLFAQDVLGLSGFGYGVLISTYGACGVLGSLIAERVIERLGAGKILRWALVVEAAIPAAIALSDSPVVVGLLLALFGCHAVIWGALLTALRQQLTPDGLRGRVESAYRLIESGGAAPGALLGGILATHLGLAAPYWLGAAVALGLIPFAWPVFSDANVQRAHREAEAPV